MPESDASIRPLVYVHKPDNIYKNSRLSGLLQEAGYTLTDEIAGADWAITSYASELPHLTGHVRQILLATIEPRPAFGRVRREVIDGTVVHTRDLSAGAFADIWMFFIEFGWVDPVVPHWSERTGDVCMVAGNRWMTPGIADLNPARRMLAEEGQRRGVLDLWGSGWEGLKVQGESRLGDGTRSFSAIKHDILQSYRFNIALENTHLPRYVTEKFWHSVRAGCVPVYFGSVWMDQLVPRGTYVDLRDQASPAAVYEACQALAAPQAEEWVLTLQSRMEGLRTAHRLEIDSLVTRWLVESVEVMRSADDVAAVLASGWTPTPAPEPVVSHVPTTAELPTSEAGVTAPPAEDDLHGASEVRPKKPKPRTAWRKLARRIYRGIRRRLGALRR